MSVRWMAEVFELAGLSEPEGFLLLAIADHADDDGIAYPSVARLAHKLGCTPRSVQQRLRKLEARGLLVLHREASGQQARRYRLVFAGMARKLAFSPRGEHMRSPLNARSPLNVGSPQGRSPDSPQGRSPCSPEPSVTISEPPVSRKRRLPSDFVFSEALRAVAREKGCRAPETLFAAFCDYWWGTGTPMLDWSRTFATWARRAHGGPPGLACSCGGLPAMTRRPSAPNRELERIAARERELGIKRA